MTSRGLVLIYAAVVLACAILGLKAGFFAVPVLGLLAGAMAGLILCGLASAAIAGRGGPAALEALSSGGILKGATVGYMLLFFAYMFLPLILMVVAAFNTRSVPPTAVPFEGFTLHWFGDLFGNEPLWASVVNSLIIGLGVVALSLSMGLAGALLITRLQTRARSFLYAVLVSPLLTPGIILGISALVFWSNLGVGGGLFVAIVAQGTFISAYCMLMFIARLQRFDSALEEAALDLGASHRQVFRRITLPFLKPTLITGGVIAFLQSFENFNTTVFAIGTETTLTIKLAALARKTPTPEVNALACLFIGLTLVIALVYELKRRAEAARNAALAERAKRADQDLARGGIAAQALPATAPAAPAVQPAQ